MNDFISNLSETEYLILYSAISFIFVMISWLRVKAISNSSIYNFDVPENLDVIETALLNNVHIGAVQTAITGLWLRDLVWIMGHGYAATIKAKPGSELKTNNKFENAIILFCQNETKIHNLINLHHDKGMDCEKLTKSYYLKFKKHKLLTSPPDFFDRADIFWVPAIILISVAFTSNQVCPAVASPRIYIIMILVIAILRYLTWVSTFKLTNSGKRILNNLKLNFERDLKLKFDKNMEYDDLLMGVALFGKCYSRDDSTRDILNDALSAVLLDTPGFDRNCLACNDCSGCSGCGGCGS
jgi:hypothetical protein